MSRIRLSHQIKALQQQHDALSGELQTLQRNKRALLIRQAILSSWCETFNLIQSVTAVQLPSAEHVDAEQFRALLQEEVQLLQQLTTSKGRQQPGLLQPDTGLAALVVQPDVQPTAPCTDPMAYLRSILLRPLQQDAATMTAEQYAAVMQKLIIDLSIKLHKLNCCPERERAGRLQEIADMGDRFYHHAMSLALLGQHDVVQEAYNYNLETMQPDSTAWQRQEEQAPELVSAMDLSEQQQELIAVGFRLFLDLQKCIQQEQQDVQAQMAALDAGAGAANTSPAAAGKTCCRHSASSSSKGSSSGSSSSSQTDNAALNILTQHARLEKQEVLAVRLKLLLFKVYCLRMAANGWVNGCLTYEQLAQAIVLSWPYSVRTVFLGAEVMKQREALLQGRH